MNAISLRDYRLSCPPSAPIPTITQSGLIGPILTRQHRRALRKMQRRARVERLLSLMVKSSVRLWRFFTAPSQPSA